VVREIMARDFGGNLSATAKALGVTPAALHDFVVTEQRGAGMKLLDGIARYTKRSIDDLVGHRVEYDRPPGLDRTAIGNHRMWQRVRGETLARYGRFIEPTKLDEVAAVSLSKMPEVLTVEFVKGVYDVLVQLEADEVAARARPRSDE
jgi:hypothetical protein